MARPNIPFGGFRFVGSAFSGNYTPNVIERQVATAYGTAIFTGDPVKKVSDGTVSVSAAGEAVFGVVAYVRYADANGNPVDRNYVPASTAYSVDRLRTIVGVIIAYPGIYFEACSNALIATVATARTYVDENVDHVATATGNTTTGRSGFELAMSTHGTASSQWRLVQLSPDPSNDPTQTQHRWWVEANESHNLPGTFSTTGI